MGRKRFDFFSAAILRAHSVCACAEMQPSPHIQCVQSIPLVLVVVSPSVLAIESLRTLRAAPCVAVSSLKVASALQAWILFAMAAAIC